MAHISYELEIISALPDPLMSWARLQRSHLPALLNPNILGCCERVIF